MELQPVSPEDTVPNGSVIMLNGPSGTAYQRYFSTGLFHGTNGQVLAFNELFEIGDRAPLLVYRAQEIRVLTETKHGAFTLFVDPDTRTVLFVYDAAHQTLTLSDNDVRKNLNTAAARHIIRCQGYDVEA